MFKNLFNKERTIEKDRAMLEVFERNTPGIKVIVDTVVDAIVTPTSGVVQNMRNSVFGQYLLFTKHGVKHIVQATSGVDIKQMIKETPYNFTFAELGKNPLQPSDVEKFKDLIKLRLNDYPWMKVINSYIHNNCMDAISSSSLSIEKSRTAEIPETFWGNDIKF